MNFANMDMKKHALMLKEMDNVHCENSAGFEADDPYGLIRNHWNTLYSGDKWSFSTNEDHYHIASKIITEQAIVRWNVCFADLPKGEGYFARDALSQNMAYVETVLGKLDEKFAEDSAQPTRCFRDWLENKFMFPVSTSNAVDNQESFKQVRRLREKTMEKRMKEEVHSIKDDRRKKREVFKQVRTEVAQMLCEEMEEMTDDFRTEFGGSRKHACLYCFLNHPCHACGGKYPISKPIPTDGDGKFISATKSGKKYAGRWGDSFGCSTHIVRQSGIHLCHGCLVSSAMYRGRCVKAARKNRKNLEEMRKSTDPGDLDKADTFENQMKSDPCNKIYVRGGNYIGESLHFKIYQGEKLMVDQPEDCDLSRRHEMTWLKKDGTEVVLADAEQGKNGARKSNGCSKANRERIREDKDAKRRKKREERLAKERAEEERRVAERLSQRRHDEKAAWSRHEAEKRMDGWWEEARENCSHETTLQERCYGIDESEYERQAERYVGGLRSTFQQRTFNEMSHYETLADFLEKKAEDARDMKKYGRVIDTSAAAWDTREAREAKINRDDSSMLPEIANGLDDGIAAAKKRMFEARANYVAEQAVKRQKI